MFFSPSPVEQSEEAYMNTELPMLSSTTEILERTQVSTVVLQDTYLADARDDKEGETQAFSGNTSALRISHLSNVTEFVPLVKWFFFSWLWLATSVRGIWIGKLDVFAVGENGPLKWPDSESGDGSEGERDDESKQDVGGEYESKGGVMMTTSQVKTDLMNQGGSREGEEDNVIFLT